MSSESRFYLIDRTLTVHGRSVLWRLEYLDE
jgi:hypothetical protein